MHTNSPNLAKRRHGFSLVEVVVAASIAAVIIGGIIQGYIQAGARAEYSGYSFAAQNLAQQRLEQSRSAKWDPERNLDELVSANFPPQITILDLPVAGTNVSRATNFTTIVNVRTNAPMLKMLRVDTVWRGPRGNLHTNSCATYRTPDT
jgi:prepilin-type N-terminal cleavage/methylation domain-containing protein